MGQTLTGNFDMASVEKENLSPLGELSKNELKNKSHKDIKQIEEKLQKMGVADDREKEMDLILSSQSHFDPQVEPLLKENAERFVIFPINYQGRKYSTKAQCIFVFLKSCF